MAKRTSKTHPPIHSEQTLFVLCMSFALLTLFHADMRDAIEDFLFEDGEGIVTGFLLLFGFIVSMTECLKRRKKNDLSKATMGTFVLLLMIIAGILALPDSNKISFPTWHFFTLLSLLNMAYPAFLLYSIRYEKLDPSDLITDEDMPLLDLVVLSLVLGLLLFVLETQTSLSWGAILSALNFYTLFLSGFIVEAFHRLRFRLKGEAQKK